MVPCFQSGELLEEVFLKAAHPGSLVILYVNDIPSVVQNGSLLQFANTLA